MSDARGRFGSWLRAAAASRVPWLRRAFDLSRDPLIARQIADLEKSEAQRREESGERHAGAEKPEPALKPPRPMRGDAERDGWLIAQRDAAFARAAAHAGRKAVPEPRPQPVPVSPGPML